MSNGSIWHRTLVYFGLAEDDTMPERLREIASLAISCPPPEAR